MCVTSLDIMGGETVPAAFCHGLDGHPLGYSEQIKVHVEKASHSGTKAEM
jgi:hypothetical protein